MLVTGSNVQSNRLPWVTIILIVINFGVFAKSYTLECQAAHEWRTSQTADLPVNKELFSFYEYWGFSMEDLTERTELVSLISHMFVHLGLMHFVGNMLMLWAFGSALEGALKPALYLTLYMTTGLAAAFAQGAVSFGADIPCVGASGAIAGLMGGFFVVFGTKAKLDVLIFFVGVHITKISALAYGGCWISLQIFNFVMSDSASGGVAWMAHIGGCVVGAGIVYILQNELEVELLDNNEGNVEIQHAEDIEQPSEMDILEQVLDLHRIATVATEFLGESSLHCDKCNGVLDVENEIGNRLIRCQACQELVYVDAKLMINSRDAQQQAMV